MKKIAGLAIAAVLAVVSSAHAGIDGPYSVNIPTTSIGDPNVTVQLPQFDPSMGTLVKVTLTLDVTTTGGTIVHDNEAGSPSDVTLGVGATVEAFAPSALTVVAVPLQTDTGSVEADSDAAADFVGDDSFAIATTSGSDDDTAMLLNTFAPYVGTGTFDTVIKNTIETFLSTSGGFGPNDANPGTFDGTVTVTYEYIPEPASLALLGLGGLCLIRRRR